MVTYSRRVLTSALLCISCLCGELAIAQSETLVIGEPVTLPLTERAMSAAGTDLNGDGFVDVVVGVNSASPVVFLNNGTTDPFDNVAGQPTSGSDQQRAAYVADLNRDGHPDIISIPSTKLYLNNGTSNPFAGVPAIEVNPILQMTQSLAVADLNDDGFADLGLANERRSNVILNNGSADPFNGSAVLDIGAEAENAADIALADVNGDDLPDAILTFPFMLLPKPAGIYVYINNATNDPFAEVSPLILIPGTRAYQIEIADLNNDQRPDLIATEDDGNVILFHTKSNVAPYGAPTPLSTSNIETACHSIDVFDIDRDATLDLILGCGVPSEIDDATTGGGIYLNNGTADSFAGVEAIPLPKTDDYSRSVQIVDFDGSGELSLLVAERSALYMPLRFVPHPLANDDSFNLGTGSSIRADVLRNDRSGGTLDRSSISITVAPLHGIASIDPDSQAILYQAEAGFVGDDSLQYTVRDTDGGVSNAATVSFSVLEGSLMISDDSAIAFLNGVATFDVLANDPGMEGTLDPSSLTIVRAPNNGTARVVPDSFVIEYQPGAGFTGSDSLMYSVGDNLGAVYGPATVSISVINPDPSPVPQGGRSGGGSFNLLLLLALSMLTFVKRFRRSATTECSPAQRTFRLVPCEFAEPSRARPAIRQQISY